MEVNGDLVYSEKEREKEREREWEGMRGIERKSGRE